MARAYIVGFLLLVGGAVAHAAPVDAAPAIPDTPAGHTLRAWLDAFNSGDRARIAAYHEKYESKGEVDETLSFRRQTGGFDLLGVDQSTRLGIGFRVKERAGPREAVGRIDVSDGEPAKIVHFLLRAAPPGMSASAAAITVDAATRARVLDGIVAQLSAHYIYPDGAKKMVDALRAHQKSGDYDSITDGYSFAATLTDHLQAVSRDLHLHVDGVPRVLPAADPPPEGPPLDDAFRAQLARDNCGFEKAERLEGNIGYLKINSFGPPEACSATAKAAMSFLAHVDGIIFDLRENHGGDSDMVAIVASALFAKRTHLNDLYFRDRNKTEESWTRPELAGPRLSVVPAWVLTSKHTFSGGEEFSYDLKNLKRATLVGETTGGGAHPVAPHRVDDHFLIGVPSGRPINPITKTDWEGTGVKPDVATPAADALETALKQARAAGGGPRRK